MIRSFITLYIMVARAVNYSPGLQGVKMELLEHRCNTALIAVITHDVSCRPSLYRFFLIYMGLVDMIPYGGGIFDFGSHYGFIIGCLDGPWTARKRAMLLLIFLVFLHMWSLVKLVVADDSQVHVLYFGGSLQCLAMDGIAGLNYF